MKLKEFVNRVCELLNMYGCTVKKCTYDFRLNNVDIVDTYDTRFRMYISNFYTSVNVDPVLVLEFYMDDTLCRIHITVDQMCIIDPLTVLIEMNMPRLFIRSMARLAEQRMDVSLPEIVDDIVFSNNETALNIALNTNYESICNEDRFCSYSLETEHVDYVSGFGIVVRRDLSGVFLLRGVFIKGLVNKYPDSTKCIPILLRYLNEHFVFDEDGGIGL